MEGFAKRSLRWYWAATAMTVLGLSGLCWYAMSDRARPAAGFLQVRFPGSYSLPGTVLVPAAGPYAIWATGWPSPDGNRCRVTTDTGLTVPVSTPRTTIEYTVAGEDDAVYTWIASFSAPTPGTYVLQCATDPNAPGAAIQVSSAPSTAALTAGRLLSLAVLLGGATIAIVTAMRRYRSRHRGPPTDRGTTSDRTRPAQRSQP